MLFTPSLDTQSLLAASRADPVLVAEKTPAIGLTLGHKEQSVARQARMTAFTGALHFPLALPSLAG